MNSTHHLHPFADILRARRIVWRAPAFVLAGVGLAGRRRRARPAETHHRPEPVLELHRRQVAGSQAGTLYPQTEIEPWIDANPRHPRNLIVGWQQDRWSNGGARGDVSAYTLDGGATWNTVVAAEGHRLHRRPLQARQRPLGHLLAERCRLLHVARLRPGPAERRRSGRTRCWSAARPMAGSPGAIRSRSSRSRPARCCTTRTR